MTDYRFQKWIIPTHKNRQEVLAEIQTKIPRIIPIFFPICGQSKQTSHCTALCSVVYLP